MLTFFITTIIIVIYGFGSQIYKILKLKNAKGVSLNTYIVAILANLSILWFAIETEVKIIASLEIPLALLTTFLIYYYNHKNNIKTEEKEPKLYLIISIIFALGMIYGVSQALKSFTHKGITHNVSATSYFIWMIYSLLMIQMSSSFLVITAMMISYIFYVYIIYRSIDFKDLEVSLSNKILNKGI